MIKYKKRPVLTDIEVGSFSDIAFLLIIFFILTTQIVRLTGRPVDIPAGSETSDNEKKSDKKQMMIHLTSGNQITVNDDTTKISLEQLRVLLLEQKFQDKADVKDKFVILEAQADISYDLYYKVMMMIDDAGGILMIMDSAPAANSKGES